MGLGRLAEERLHAGPRGGRCQAVDQDVEVGVGAAADDVADELPPGAGAAAGAADGAAARGVGEWAPLLGMESAGVGE